MKLKKLLLPIAGVASVAAVVAPVVTSCGAATKMNLEDLFEGKFERKSSYKEMTDGMNTDTATKTYLEDLSKNKKLLADDIFDYITLEIKDQNESVLPEGLKGSIGLTVKNVDTEDQRITVVLNANVTMKDAKIVTVNEDEGPTFNGKISGSITLGNVKVAVGHREGADVKDYKKWYLASAYDFEEWEQGWADFLADDKITLALNASGNLKVGDLSADINAHISTDSQSIEEGERIAQQFLGEILDFDIPLPYFKDVAYKA